MIRIPFDGTRTPKLCKDCKHFIVPPPHIELRAGLCKKGGMIDLVDGNVTYNYASTIRAHKCKGALWERIDEN